MQAAITAACAGSDLDGCADCPSQDNCPDTLETLNKLCQADPEVAVCADRKAMCIAAGENLSIFCEGIEGAAEGNPPLSSSCAIPMLTRDACILTLSL